MAERHCLVPIFVRRVRGQGETLYIAMDNPDDELAREEVAQYSGLPVRAMIAPPSDIRSAIRAYYGGGREAAAEGGQPAAARPRPRSLPWRSAYAAKALREAELAPVVRRRRRLRQPSERLRYPRRWKCRDTERPPAAELDTPPGLGPADLGARRELSATLSGAVDV